MRRIFFSFIVAFSISAGVAQSRAAVPTRVRESVWTFVRSYAKSHHISVPILGTIVQAESGGNPSVSEVDSNGVSSTRIFSSMPVEEGAVIRWRIYSIRAIISTSARRT